MNAEFEAPKDVPAVQQAGDTSGLSSAQSDSFNGFDRFSSIKSSMSDSSKTGLPELQLLDTDSQPADTSQNRVPGESQNPGDSPQNPDPNRRQNPGDGERNDDPRSKNQPGSDASGKQPGVLDESAGVQADGGSKDLIDDRAKDTPPDNHQKQLDGGQSNGKQQPSDIDGPLQPPAQEDDLSKDIRDNGSKPNPDDPGASKQPGPDGKQKNPQSAGDETSATPRQDALPGGGGSDGKTDPAKPGVTPRPEYNF